MLGTTRAMYALLPPCQGLPVHHGQAEGVARGAEVSGHGSCGHCSWDGWIFEKRADGTWRASLTNRLSDEDARTQNRTLDRIGREAADRGLKLCIHNHEGPMRYGAKEWLGVLSHSSSQPSLPTSSVWIQNW